MEPSTILAKRGNTDSPNSESQEPTFGRAESGPVFSRRRTDRPPSADRAESNQKAEAGADYPPDMDLADQPATNALHDLLERFQADLESLWGDDASPYSHGGPDAVALTVIQEATAIGLTMTEGDEAESYRLPLRTMNHRYLENRTRALRTALHGVDDYVWWGGITEQ